MEKYSKEKISIIVQTNIRKYRLQKKYTLQELADLTGLTHGYVRDLECLSINKTPLLETLGKFADALDIDIRQLFDEIPEDKKNKKNPNGFFYFQYGVPEEIRTLDTRLRRAMLYPAELPEQV